MLLDVDFFKLCSSSGVAVVNLSLARPLVELFYGPILLALFYLGAKLLVNRRDRIPWQLFSSSLQWVL